MVMGFGFSQNLGKGVRNGPKLDLFNFFSNLALRIFLIFCMLLQVSDLILAKTAYLGKILFWSFGPKRVHILGLLSFGVVLGYVLLVIH